MNRKILIAAVVVIALLVAVGITVWYKLYRDVRQPGWITTDARSNFLYGSIGTESAAGIPYWIWLALPRMFPEYLPGPGGYASLGFSWEEGTEMPVGFSKKIVGYVRVAGNCALCHAASYRKTPEDVPTVTESRPGRKVNAERLLSFYTQCAKDPRFNAGDILAEVAMATKLSLLDRLLYRFVLIPGTRKAILDGRPVLIDAALRDHSRNPQSGTHFTRKPEQAQESRLKQCKAPAYPLAVDATLASAGKQIFAQHCNSCHAAEPAGKSLNGIWLRGPYLQNGSVPTVRDLLAPVEQRPRTFYSGNDLINFRDVGFLSTEATDMGRQFLFYDTAKPGNGNSGHVYGTNLPASDKAALLEYLKTF